MLPYENATSGDKTIAEIQKTLERFGCGRFGVMTDNDEGCLIMQFAYKGREVMLKASFKGYAAAWLKEHPYTYRTKSSRTDHEKKALAVARIAVYSVLRDWIKGQIVAVETGILSFEGAFLGQILLGNGRTVLDFMQNEAKLLTAPTS